MVNYLSMISDALPIELCTMSTKKLKNWLDIAKKIVDLLATLWRIVFSIVEFFR
jgi:hypothetical protein